MYEFLTFIQSLENVMTKLWILNIYTESRKCYDKIITLLYDMIPLLWESLFQQSYDKDITNLYQSYDRVMTMTKVITKLWQSHSIVLTKCVMRKF